MKTIIVVENATLSYFKLVFRLLEKTKKCLTRPLGQLYNYVYVRTLLLSQRLQTKAVRLRTESKRARA